MLGKRRKKMTMVDALICRAQMMPGADKQKILDLQKVRKKRYTVTHFPSLGGTPQQFDTILQASMYANSLGPAIEINLADNKEKIDYMGWNGLPPPLLKARQYPMFDWKKYYQESGNLEEVKRIEEIEYSPGNEVSESGPKRWWQFWRR